MTSATTVQEEPAITIDTSRQYEINAGKCEHCGNFKTWQFKIPNPKTGKMMPGHVTAEGFKINDGDCPYWAAIRANKKNGGGNGAKPVKRASAPKASNGTGTGDASIVTPAGLKLQRIDGDTVAVIVPGSPAIEIRFTRDDARDFTFDLASKFD